MPPIDLIEIAPPGVSVNAEAFVLPGRRTIYLITSSRAFREASREASANQGCDITNATRKLASILAHEEWHVKHGSEEKGAYEWQLLTLLRLGLTPGTGVYRDVQVSMLKVLDARKRDRPDRVLASR
jgi:hypothetical protein